MTSELISKNSIYHEFVPLGKWAGRVMFHGTSESGARSILKHGIRQDKSTKGYFGRGFYMAPDYDLAKNNYADFADDDKPGVVIAAKIKESANILDLRLEDHYEEWLKVSGNGKLIGNDDFDCFMVRQGIDGLFDRSFGGVVIYNTKSVEILSGNV